jgi:DNA-binding winged helix-turn-helix (wHTH) protein
MTLDFGDCEINLERRELWRAKRAVHVEPQVFDLLVYLVQNRDRVVSKDDLIASVWGGRIVSESTLTSRINAARTAVGDSGRKQQLIRTIPRKGLRFIGAVHTQGGDDQPAQATDPPSNEIRNESRAALLLPDRPAIAVLPFTNMSGDPEQEYFPMGSARTSSRRRLSCAGSFEREILSGIGIPGPREDAWIRNHVW